MRPFHSTATAGVAAFILAALAFGHNAATAQALDAVKARGDIIVGVQGDNPPYGYLDTQGKNDGYDADIARLLGEDLKLPVQFFVVTNQNRIAALQSGKVDVLFAALSMTPQRAKAVQYSEPYAEQPFSVLAAKSAKITSLMDLKGVTLGVPKGSLEDIQLTKLAPDANIRRFDDDSSNVQALLSGQVDAVGGSVFYAARLEQQAPGKFENKFALTSLYIGPGARPHDKDWNAALNAFVEHIRANGKLAALYRKWFGMDMPSFPSAVDGVPFTIP